MADLTEEQVESLQILRRSLATVSTTLTGLHGNLSESLLNQADLQRYANSASEGLQKLTLELDKNRDLLSKIVAVPNAAFPIHTRYMVAEHLLATGISLPVQDWLESGEEYTRDADNDEILSDYERRKLWYDAIRTGVTVARKQKWGADYTLAEVEAGVDTIHTGLKRELVEPPLDDDDDDEDFDDDDDQEDDDDQGAAGGSESMDVDAPAAAAAARVVVDPASAVPPMTMDVLMRFMSTARDP